MKLADTPPRRAGHMTGMRGVYLVSAELARLGFIVSPTSRSAIGADILATNQTCTKAFSVQVKTNASTFGFWLLGKKAQKMVSRTHIYVLVNIRSSKKAKTEAIEFYIVPSKVLAANMKFGEHWCQINMSDVSKYRDKWSVFGSPTA